MQSEETYYKEILSRVSTREEANLLADEIDGLIASLYKTEQGVFDKTLDSFVRAKTALGIKKAILAGFDRKSFLKGLKERLESLNTLRLTLAFEPSQETFDKIHNLVVRNLGGEVLLETQEDRSILGGALIAYQGKYIDGSLNSAVEEYFSKKTKNG